MATTPTYPPVPAAIAEEGSLRVSRPWLAFFTTLLNQSAAAGPGNVVGPSSSTDGQIALFNGATGKILKGATGSGIVKATSGVYSTIALPADATKYLDGTGAFTVPAGTGINQLTGDVTAGPGSGSQAATIANDAVTYAKMQNVSAASRLLGRGSASGSGDVQEITLDSSLAMTGTVLSASSGVLRATLPLTNAQIIALPTVPLTVIAAPASGSWNKILGGSLVIDNAAGAYGNINADAGIFVMPAGVFAWLVQPIVNDTSIVPSVTQVTDLLKTNVYKQVVPLVVPYSQSVGAVAGTLSWVLSASLDGGSTVGAPTALVDGLATQLSIDNNGSMNLSGGHAANSGKLTLYYTVESL